MEPNDVKSKLEDIEEEEVKPDVEEALQRLRAAVPEPKNRVKKEEDAEEAPARLLASDAVEDREAMNVDSGAGAVEADVGAVEDVAVKVLSSAGQEDTSTGHGGRSSAHPSTKYQKTSRTLPLLPAEVLSRIFHHLDHESLPVCALVNHFFLRLARPIIWRSLRLEIWRESDKPERCGRPVSRNCLLAPVSHAMLEFLKERSHISDHVKHLDIRARLVSSQSLEGYEADAWKHLMQRQGGTRHPPTDQLDDDALLDVFKVFCQARSVSITDLDAVLVVQIDSVATGRLQSSIHALGRSRALRSLRFVLKSLPYNTEFLVNALARPGYFPRLKHLTALETSDGRAPAFEQYWRWQWRRVQEVMERRGGELVVGRL